jgi:hypothetical protein
VAERSLLAQHQQLIEASAISPEVAEERGYRSVTSDAELARIGFSPAQCRVPTLLLPVWTVWGEVAFCQSRPDQPRLGAKGKPIKYETPAGVRMRLDVPPRSRVALADPGERLWITEGIRKVDALVSAGACAIGLLGVWNWRGTNEKGGKTALGDWHEIALNGRPVRLVFDSDTATNPQVRRALAGLASYLDSKGATVDVVFLPEELP